MNQDPNQPDHSGVTEHYAAHHQWWKPLLWLVGGSAAGAYDRRRHPMRYALVSTLIVIAFAAVAVYLIHASATDPRNTPLPIATGS